MLAEKKLQQKMEKNLFNLQLREILLKTDCGDIENYLIYMSTAG